MFEILQAWFARCTLQIRCGSGGWLWWCGGVGWQPCRVCGRAWQDEKKKSYFLKIFLHTSASFSVTRISILSYRENFSEASKVRHTSSAFDWKQPFLVYKNYAQTEQLVVNFYISMLPEYTCLFLLFSPSPFKKLQTLA